MDDFPQITFLPPATINAVIEQVAIQAQLQAPAIIAAAINEPSKLVVTPAPALQVVFAQPQTIVTKFNTVLSNITLSIVGQEGEIGPPGEAAATEVTSADIAYMVANNSLEPKAIYFNTETQTLIVAETGNTYKTYYGIYVGPTAPADTSVIWLQTL